MRKAIATIICCGLLLEARAQDVPDWLQSAPDFYFRSFLHLQVWQWIGLVVLAILGVAGAGIGYVLAKVAVGLRDRLPNPYSLSVRRGIKRSGALLLFAWTVEAFQDQLSLPAKPDHWVYNVAQVFLIAGVVLGLVSLWNGFMDSLFEKKIATSFGADRLLLPVVRKLLQGAILAGGILTALAELFSINFSALIASLGIGGLVIALAGKDSVENVLGSLTLVFDMPFALGDWVRIDKIEGIVEEVNLRSTRIRTFEDTLITLPNANLIRASVENCAARRSRRQVLSVRLASGAEPAVLRDLVSQVKIRLESISGVETGKSIVAINSQDELSMSLFIQCFLDAPTQAAEMEMRQQVLFAVLETGKELKIRFANAPIIATDDAKPVEFPKSSPKQTRAE